MGSDDSNNLNQNTEDFNDPLVEAENIAPGQENELLKLRSMVEKLGGIQHALKKISQGTVSRTTLAVAVREVLQRLLAEERQTLLPELAGVQAEVDNLRRSTLESLERQRDTLGQKLEEFQRLGAQSLEQFQSALQNALNKVLASSKASSQEKIDQLEERFAALDCQLEDRSRTLEKTNAELGNQLKTLERALEGRLEAAQNKMAGDLLEKSARQDKALESLGQELHRLLLKVEERRTVDSARLEERLKGDLDQAIGPLAGALSDRMKQLERRIGELALHEDAGLRELSRRLEGASRDAVMLEDRLKREFASSEQDNMKEIQAKLNDLNEMVASLPGLLPPRRIFDTLDDRLDQIEEKFKLLTQQLHQVEEFMPELKATKERFKSLQDQIARLSAEIVTAEREVVEFREHTTEKLHAVQDLLKKGLDRRDLDRSLVNQRILDLRDTLKDQLQGAIERSRSTRGTLWNRLSGHREQSPLQLEPEEWDRFRSRLETVLEGLEGLIADQSKREIL